METIPRKSRRGIWKAAAILLFVFLLGNLTGVGASAALMLKRLQSNVRDPAASQGVATKFIDRTGDKLAEELELTATEKAGVQEELEVTRQRLADIRVRMVGELRLLSRDTIDRIATRLPENKRRILRERAAERLRPWGFSQ